MAVRNLLNHSTPTDLYAINSRNLDCCRRLSSKRYDAFMVASYNIFYAGCARRRQLHQIHWRRHHPRQKLYQRYAKLKLVWRHQFWARLWCRLVKPFIAFRHSRSNHELRQMSKLTKRYQSIESLDDVLSDRAAYSCVSSGLVCDVGTTASRQERHEILQWQVVTSDVGERTRQRPTSAVRSDETGSRQHWWHGAELIIWLVPASVMTFSRWLATVGRRPTPDTWLSIIMTSRDCRVRGLSARSKQPLKHSTSDRCPFCGNKVQNTRRFIDERWVDCKRSPAV